MSLPYSLPSTLPTLPKHGPPVGMTSLLSRTRRMTTLGRAPSGARAMQNLILNRMGYPHRHPILRSRLRQKIRHHPLHQLPLYLPSKTHHRLHPLYHQRNARHTHLYQYLHYALRSIVNGAFAFPPLKGGVTYFVLEPPSYTCFYCPLALVHDHCLYYHYFYRSSLSTIVVARTIRHYFHLPLVTTRRYFELDLLAYIHDVSSEPYSPITIITC